jgi:hypothetical protein
MHNDGITHTHGKPIQKYYNFFMPSFVGLSMLWCGVFRRIGSKKEDITPKRNWPLN